MNAIMQLSYIQKIFARFMKEKTPRWELRVVVARMRRRYSSASSLSFNAVDAAAAAAAAAADDDMMMCGVAFSG